MLQFRSLILEVRDSLCPRPLQLLQAKLGPLSPSRTGLRFPGQPTGRWMVTASQRWARWRRLLLRLLASAALQCWQIFQEVLRTPQLREVRRIQQRRQRLEEQALLLAQQEQRVLSEAKDSAPSLMTSGQLTTARREERVRPLAMVKGNGKYLVPALEPSPMCSHHLTKHGANRILCYHECTECLQRQTMPLTPLTELHHWNNHLCFIPDPFYDKKDPKSKTKAKNQKVESSSPSDSSTPLMAQTPKAAAASMTSARLTAYKSRARPMANKIEIKEEDVLDQDMNGANSWCDVVANQLLRFGREQEEAEAAMIGDPHEAMAQILSEALSQSCDNCQTGEVMLHRHSPSMNLLWKCDNSQCSLHWGQLNDAVHPAVGTILCPRCHSREMLEIAPGMSPEDQEMQCMDEQCGLAAYMFEIPTAYARIGRFNTNLLVN